MIALLQYHQNVLIWSIHEPFTSTPKIVAVCSTIYALPERKESICYSTVKIGVLNVMHQSTERVHLRAALFPSQQPFLREGFA